MLQVHRLGLGIPGVALRLGAALGAALGALCGAEQGELTEATPCERGFRFGVGVQQEQGRVVGRRQEEPGLRGGVQAAC